MFLPLKASAYNVDKQEREQTYVCYALEAAGEIVSLNIRGDVWAQGHNWSRYIPPQAPCANAGFAWAG